jgi:hypothetical protein
MAVLNTEVALETALKAVGVARGAKLPHSVPLNTVFASAARTIADPKAQLTFARFLINRTLDVIPLGQERLPPKSDGRVIKGTLVADFLRFAAMHRLLTERWYQLAQLCVAPIQFAISRAGLGNTIRASVFKPTAMRHSLDTPRAIAQVKQTTYRHLCIESRELSAEVFKWFAGELLSSDELELTAALRLRSVARRADLPLFLSCLSGRGIARGAALSNRDLIDALLDCEVASDTSRQRLGLLQIIERVLIFEDFLPHHDGTMPIRKADLDASSVPLAGSTDDADTVTLLHGHGDPALVSGTVGAMKGTAPLTIERQRPRELLLFGCSEPSDHDVPDIPWCVQDTEGNDLIFGELDLE